jgi:hypothetical protein
MAKATHGQRLLIIAMLTIAIMTPPVLLTISGQSGLAAVFVYGGVIVVAATFVDLRLAAALAALSGVAAVIAALLNPHPVAGAVFFGLLTAACALSAKRGLSSPVLMVPVFVSFVLVAPPTVEGMTSTTAAFVTGAVMLLGGLWTIAGARLLLGRPRRRSEATPHGTRATIAYAGLMGIVLGLAAWAVLTHAKYHEGAWLLLTLIIVMQPSPDDTVKRALQRLAGTLIGGVAALGFIFFDISPTAAFIIGGILLFGALALRYVLKRPYWEYVAVLTPAAILMDSPGVGTMRVAEDRVVFTVIAVVIGMGIALVIKVLLLRSAHRVPSA